MKQKIYFDNAATSPVRKEVFEEMQKYFVELYGNPSSVYEIARTSKKALDVARKQVAAAINSEVNEIFFTSGGTEADNWALKGIAEAYKDKGNHIITSSIEHPAIRNTCQYLEKQGIEVTYLPVDKYGIISLEDLKKAIKKETILISIMFANNEIGTIQPIKEIGTIAKENKVLFHTDAVQAVGHIPVNVKDMNIDLLSLSGHKLRAAKGVGALYVRSGVKIRAILHGGAQERKRRAGTENLPGIVGLGKAIELCCEEMPAKIEKLTKLRDMLIEKVLQEIPHTSLNGHAQNRLPGNANISFEFIEGESLLLRLDMKGICVSSGSACSSASLDPSHVLLAIGLPHELAHGSMRMTLEDNTKDEVNMFLKELVPIVQSLRDMSPLYEEFLNGSV